MRRFLSLAALLGAAACASPHNNDLKSIALDLLINKNIQEDDHDNPAIPAFPGGSLPAPQYPKYFSIDSLTEKRKEILIRLYSRINPGKQDPTDDELLNLQKNILFGFYGSKNPANEEVAFPKDAMEKLHYTVFDF